MTAPSSPAFRGTLTEEALAAAIRSGVKPKVMLRAAVRSYDATLEPKVRKAVYRAELAPDAKPAKREAAWVQAQLDKRRSYYSRVASMLKMDLVTARAYLAADLTRPPFGVKAVAVRTGSLVGNDWSRKAGTTINADGTAAKVKATAVPYAIRSRAEAAADRAARELGVSTPRVKFYESTGAVRSDKHGLFTMATPDTVWIERRTAEHPLLLEETVAHEVAHVAQAVRGRPIDEAQADAFAAGSRRAAKALRGAS